MGTLFEFINRLENTNRRGGDQEVWKPGRKNCAAARQPHVPAAGWICCLGESLGCGSTVFLSAGGHDLKEIPPEQLYDQAAFVLQDNDLFDDTVRENIRMGRRGAADAQAEVAAHAAGCDSFSIGQPGMCADFIGGRQETKSWKL